MRDTRESQRHSTPSGPDNRPSPRSVGIVAAAVMVAVVFAPPGLPDGSAWMMVGALGLLLITGLSARRHHTGSLLPSGVLLPAAGLWLLSLLSSAIQGYATTVIGLVTPVCWLVYLWVGWWLARDTALLRTPARALGISLGAVGVIALSQSFELEIWPRTGPYLDRVVSVFTNPNHLGSLCAFCLPLITVAFLRSGSRERWFVCASAYCGLLLAGSRGAWIAAAAGLALPLIGVVLTRPVIAAHRQRGGLLLATWALTTLLVVDQPALQRPAGPLSVGQRLLETSHVLNADKRSQDATLQHRLFLWSAAATMIRQAPWLGVGPGGFANAYRYLLPGLQQQPRFQHLTRAQRAYQPHHAHNEPLHAAAETGLLGLIGLALCILICLGNGLRSWWRQPQELAHAAALGASVTVIVHALVSYPLYIPATSTGFFLLLGIMLRSPEYGADTGTQ